MAKGRIEVNTEACKSCQYCVAECPKGILAVGEEVNSKGYPYVISTKPEECVGCAMCAVVCPDAAIQVWKEVK